MILRNTLKKLVLLLPQIRRIVAQRDELLDQVKSSSRSVYFKHRPHVSFNVNPAVSAGSSVDDQRIVERLLVAYQRADVDQYGKDSMWRELFEAHHKAIHEVFMSGDVEKAHEILANPSSNNLFYGFDDLCSLHLKGLHADPKRIAYWCQDILIRLAEGIGAFRVENPEGSLWMSHAETSTDEILHAIEMALGVDLIFPDIYADAVGLQSNRGVITVRDIHALYLVHRLRQIVQGLPVQDESKICEIGAGLGRSALFAAQLGLNDYTLVDVPMTVISQGYYLMRCLGEDAVALPGEPRRSSEQISLMHAEDFLSSRMRFDLIANMDSITEFGNDLALKYLKKISETSFGFVSINHESNDIRVIDLLKKIGSPYKISRYPYWLRQGYTEELVMFQ